MISARNSGEITCHGCNGVTDVETSRIGEVSTYGNCPLCGPDDIDALLER